MFCSHLCSAGINKLWFCTGTAPWMQDVVSAARNALSPEISTAGGCYTLAFSGWKQLWWRAAWHGFRLAVSDAIGSNRFAICNLDKISGPGWRVEKLEICKLTFFLSCKPVIFSCHFACLALENWSTLDHHFPRNSTRGRFWHFLLFVLLGLLSPWQLWGVVSHGTGWKSSGAEHCFHGFELLERYPMCECVVQEQGDDTIPARGDVQSKLFTLNKSKW